MLKVTKGAKMCSIQDRGRIGFKHLGVPTSGPMDKRAHDSSNVILNNSQTDATLEVGPFEFKAIFGHPTWVCITGCSRPIFLNNTEIPSYSVIGVNSGDELVLRPSVIGVWSYIGIKNGFQTIIHLNSRSSYPAIQLGQNIEKNPILPYHEYPKKHEIRNARVRPSIPYTEAIVVSRGPEFDLLEDRKFFNSFYINCRLGNNNSRMAYFLEGTDLKCVKSEIISSVVWPGIVQLLPNGQLAVMMKDCHCTGGYPRVFFINEENLSKLAQCKGRHHLILKPMLKD